VEQLYAKNRASLRHVKAQLKQWDELQIAQSLASMISSNLLEIASPLVSLCTEVLHMEALKFSCIRDISDTDVFLQLNHW
jgi:hypothetical protein